MTSRVSHLVRLRKSLSFYTSHHRSVHSFPATKTHCRTPVCDSVPFSGLLHIEFLYSQPSEAQCTGKTKWKPQANRLNEMQEKKTILLQSLRRQLLILLSPSNNPSQHFTCQHITEVVYLFPTEVLLDHVLPIENLDVYVPGHRRNSSIPPPPLSLKPQSKTCSLPTLMVVQGGSILKNYHNSQGNIFQSLENITTSSSLKLFLYCKITLAYLSRTRVLIISEQYLEEQGGGGRRREGEGGGEQRETDLYVYDRH